VWISQGLDREAVMAAYTVRTHDATSARGAREPFCVIIEDENHQRVADLEAMTPEHARLVAGAIVMLLPKLDPGRSVVFDDARRAEARIGA
jgi:hypothetical protein